MFIKQLEAMYYRGDYICKEHHCKNETRKLLTNNRCAVIGCKGRVKAQSVSEEKANDTLRYLEGLFNYEKFESEQKLNKGKQPEVIVSQQLKNTLVAVKPYIDELL